jgi:hypothetical protein
VLSLFFAYRDLDLLAKDLKFLKETLKVAIACNGYLQKKLIDGNFISSFKKPLVAIFAFYILIIFLIWNDRVWNSLRKIQE